MAPPAGHVLGFIGESTLRPGALGSHAWYNEPVTAVATCANHSTREAIGICIECRARVCAECSTKVEGINHCVSCLRAKAKADEVVTVAAPPSRAAGISSAVAWFATLSAIAWALIAISFPG